MSSYLHYLHRHLQHYYINLQLTQIYKQHYANHNDVKFPYIWSLVARCGPLCPLWSIVVISHTVLQKLTELQISYLNN